MPLTWRIDRFACTLPRNLFQAHLYMRRRMVCVCSHSLFPHSLSTIRPQKDGRISLDHPISFFPVKSHVYICRPHLSSLSPLANHSLSLKWTSIWSASPILQRSILVGSSTRSSHTALVSRPDHTVFTMSKIQGSVKWFNESKGFGFITPTDGSKDVRGYSQLG